MRKDIFVFAAGAVLTALSVQHASSVLLWNVVTLCCGLGDRPVVQAYPVACCGFGDRPVGRSSKAITASTPRR
jgi:hypothetical protein